MIAAGFPEVAQQRFGVVHHPCLTNAAQSFISLYDHKSQVAPGGAQYHRSNGTDLHDNPPGPSFGVAAIRTILAALVLPSTSSANAAGPSFSGRSSNQSTLGCIMP